MIIVDSFGLASLLLLWAAQVFWLPRLIGLLHVLRKAILLLVLAMIVLVIVWQYVAWSSAAFTKLFLPPHQSIDYFLGFVWSRFAGHWLAALLIAFILPWGMMHLNHRFGDRFFEAEEEIFFSLGIMLTGYPGFLFYVSLMLLGGCALALVYALLKRGRAPLYFLWFPVGVFVILMEQFALPSSTTQFFRF